MLKLPNNYISYSQYELWHKTKTHREYYKRYFLNEPMFENKYLLFGKYVANTIKENNLFTVPDDLAVSLSKLPTYGIPETELVLQQRGFYVKSFLDMCSDDYKQFSEFKTGKHEWNQDRVNSHDQLLFYAWVIYDNFKIIPKCDLYWMETEENQHKELCLTGKVEWFEREITLADICFIREKVNETAKEIELAYCLFLKNEPISL